MYKYAYVYMYPYRNESCLASSHDSAGVCMSYNATWDHLLSLTQQENLLSKIEGGHWIWAYDNPNIHSSTRNECQGKAIHKCARTCHKISLTHRPSWASRCPLLYMFVYLGYYWVDCLSYLSYCHTLVC